MFGNTFLRLPHIFHTNTCCNAHTLRMCFLTPLVSNDFPTWSISFIFTLLHTRFRGTWLRTNDVRFDTSSVPWCRSVKLVLLLGAGTPISALSVMVVLFCLSLCLTRATRTVFSCSTFYTMDGWYFDLLRYYSVLWCVVVQEKKIFWMMCSVLFVFLCDGWSFLSVDRHTYFDDMNVCPCVSVVPHTHNLTWTHLVIICQSSLTTLSLPLLLCCNSGSTK
jgi:hypothetical protein